MQLLKPCDNDIYENGIVVMVTHTIPSIQLDTWVKKVAEISNQNVDWHYMGDRAVIRATGNIEAVYDAIDEIIHEHDNLYKQYSARYNPLNIPRPNRNRNKKDNYYGMGRQLYW